MGAKLASGGGGRKTDLPANSEPNVIPFIDIMLVLLIIFMVAAPMPTVDIKVDLPTRSQQSQPALERRDPTLVLIAQRDGAPVQIFVDGEETALSDLDAKVFVRAQENNPGMPVNEIYREARVFIQVENQDIAYSGVVSVMSYLQERNYAKVGIFSQRSEAVK